ncbi:NADH:flavin oxidoreductase/NADH oxidase family protein [Azotobacter vinelandii CA]|uniref:NADH:flavin oxidoreductase/NADH oxidase family protein n=2 Tax=Azotobacter vinelandii TaxID=354 RepID=C1DF81_AZOVD|nr:alkene reductase [Azotobacter vinelandii]ACO78284.1 NADH:flavin oxidoreductase/NADH oxidase family protein [Azotobacter vinelandii DJ]AGK15069.1 NADH:flavin oxidoreductase/NADH oxidase family protein [Azotobacter vinelandii CA]AGK20384.1 NADH:flavin oxidoreductase/NADH oxidase family protein [Azotobacter vinelandii CA6]WKN23992.1 alkene reductase [Azotobacter vinelandii]SFY14553.1 N-ethylmaleimide reductase [Azotobacter vinelandii]
MLFTAYRLGNLDLPNRILMPPMTRSRAGAGNVPTALMAEYYAQRASAGLIVSEGTQISQQGQGYAWTPGIHSRQQVAGWRGVTDAVHAAGGRIFAQLWHVGRISHVSLQPNGAAPVSSSPLLADGVKVFIDPEGRGPRAGVGEMVQHSAPRALSEAEIAQVVRDFAAAARHALEAGFDGVELHGANGYLINQFIDSRANTRSDGYGGSLSNRLRFLREVTEAVVAVAGRGRVGVRLAPLTTLQGAVDDTPQATYLGAAKLLDDLDVAYIHIAEADWEDAPDMPVAFKEALRLIYGGTLIYAGKYTLERAEAALRDGWADLIGFGRPFIANPDLPRRLRHGWPLNEPDASRFFGGAVAGYTDYPFATQDGQAAAMEEDVR